jgi:hypothetical protein
METDEIVLLVSLGIAGLLTIVFLFLAINTGGIKAFALYVLLPLFIISFLVGMVLLVQLIIKLNDKLDNSTSGLNKKIDTNNYMIKDSIVNVDDYLQNVDYTVIINDRNVPIDFNDPDAYPTEIRYQPKTYEPSLEIPGVTGPEGIKDVISEIEHENKNVKLLSEENVKSISIEKIEQAMIQVLPIKLETLTIEESFERESLPESLSIDETIIEDLDSLPESLSVNETIIDDFEIEFSTIEDDNISIGSNFYIENLFEIKPLHEEFLYSYDLF